MVLSVIIEISVLYPFLGGSYMGVYSNICTLLRFKQYLHNYFKCRVTAGCKDTFPNWITEFTWVNIAHIHQACGTSLYSVVEMYRERPDCWHLLTCDEETIVRQLSKALWLDFLVASVEFSMCFDHFDCMSLQQGNLHMGVIKS